MRCAKSQEQEGAEQGVGGEAQGAWGSQMDRKKGKDEAQKSTEDRPQGQKAVGSF